MTSAYIELIKKNCQEVESLSDLLNCIRSIRLPRPYAKLSLFVGMFVYSVPGFIVVINREGWFGGKEELLIYSILILFGILLILMGRTTKNEATITEYSHSDTNDDLRVEYQEINTAIRYRDKQITRLAYLSLAVIGILAAVFYEADRPFEPAVTVLGFFITFYFLVSLQSLKGTLHTLRNKRKEIASINGDFKLNNLSRVVSNRNGAVNPRPVISQFSASTINFYLHLFVIGAWILLYINSLWWNIQNEAGQVLIRIIIG